MLRMSTERSAQDLSSLYHQKHAEHSDSLHSVGEKLSLSVSAATLRHNISPLTA